MKIKSTPSVAKPVLAEFEGRVLESGAQSVWEWFCWWEFSFLFDSGLIKIGTGKIMSKR